MIDLPIHKKIILFDGICNFCNDSVLKVIKLDKEDCFVFASIQSKIGQKIINYLNIDTSQIDSIILYEPKVSYDIKSTAALKIMGNFGGLWKLSQIFWVVPESIRDMIYDFVAKNRYKWFGKKDVCVLPDTELKNKFL